MYLLKGNAGKYICEKKSHWIGFMGLTTVIPLNQLMHSWMDDANFQIQEHTEITIDIFLEEGAAYD